LAALSKERQESETLDPWPTRIWTSIFLILVLTLVGRLAGGFFCFAQLTRRYGYRGDDFPQFLRTAVIIGALCGAASACGFLFRYYRRKL